MKTKTLLALAYIFIASIYSYTYGSILTFTFRPYPTQPDEIDHRLLLKKLSDPKRLAKLKLAKQASATRVKGIPVSYAGFLTASDSMGQVTFPLRTNAESFKLIVTPRLTPIIMFGNTIHHWEFEPGSPTKIYDVSLEQDIATRLVSWKTQEASIPQDNIVPIVSIIIIARPKDIFVPLGISPAIEGSSLVLPDIYVKKGINTAINSLYMVNLSEFFGSLIHQGKLDKKDLRIITQP